jgi:very-short-patch-repair endonuclease
VLSALQALDRAAARLFDEVDFAHQSCSLLVYAFAKLGFTEAQWFNQLAGVRDWPDISAQSIANIVWAYATAGHAWAVDLVDDMIVEALPRLHEFKAQNVANLVWGLGKLGHPLDRPQLLRRAQEVLGVEEVDMSYLLNIVLEQGALPNLPGFKPQELSNTLHGCALLKRGLGGRLQLDAHLLGQLVAATVGAARQCTPQGLSNSVWACAVLGLAVSGGDLEALIAAFVELAGRNAQLVKTQEISNIVLGAATLGNAMRQHDVDALVGVLCCKVQHVNAQDVANTMWACAKMGLVVQQQSAAVLVGALLQLVRTRPGSVATQAVSNTLWACATMGHPLQQQDVDVLLGLLVQRKEQADPQHLANTVWAVSKLHPPSSARSSACRQLLAHLPGLIRSKAGQFKPQELSNIAVAAATLQHREPGLLPAVMEAAQPLLQQFNTQGLANLLWALAVLEPTASQVPMLQLLPWVVDKLGRCNAQEVAITAWACAVVLGQQVDVQLASKLLHRAASVQDPLQGESKNQLYQMVMLLPGGHAAVVAQEPGLQALLADCRDSFIAAAGDSHASDFQREVHQALQQIQGLSPSFEHATDDGLFCVDVALFVREGVRVAVEADGSSHHTRNEPHSELGKTVLRRRLLEAAGWRVVSVPWFEWRAVAASDRVAYTRGKIRGWTVHLMSDCGSAAV